MTAAIPPTTAIAFLGHPLNHWHPATLQDYVALRETSTQERMKLAFHQGWL